ncbi:hypothetical protein MKX03_005232 [Papaver bracteatum]|nr:hypothetical protein MKX03_005232 [Papaver bracteatum]
MEGEAVIDQDKILVLANKVFYLTHPDVRQIDKNRIQREIMDSVRADGMLPLIETLGSTDRLMIASSELNELKEEIDTQLNFFDEAITEAEEKNFGDIKVQKAHLAKFLFLIQNGSKDQAWEQLETTEIKTSDIGQKIDLVLYSARMGFVYKDSGIITNSIDKAKKFSAGSNLETQKHLKVYEGLSCMLKGDFKRASRLFLASLSTFKSCELLSYNTFILYSVLISIISLDRGSLETEVFQAPKILAVRDQIPHLSEFMNSLADRKYKSFFQAFVDLSIQIKLDRYLHPHYRYYATKVRIAAYSHYLESNETATLEAMATAFGELSRIDKAGKLPPETENVLSSYSG